MKKLFLTFFVTLLSAASCFANTSNLSVSDSTKYDTDSVLKVYLEKVAEDSRKVQLVFANTSDETVMLYSQFRNFCDKQPTSPGFRLWYYRGGRIVAPECAQLPLDVYTIDSGKVSLAPFEKRSFNILIGDEMLTDKLGMEIEVRYRYVKYDNDELHAKFVKTEYIEID